jgi:hypothetical protein
MEPHQNGEAEESGPEGGNNVEEHREVRQDGAEGEPSTSECFGEDKGLGEEGAELKSESGAASSPRAERKEELKRENSGASSSPRGEKSKGRGSGGKGRGKGAGGVGKESGKHGRGGKGGDGKGSETIRAAGLPSMRRTRSQPGRSRGGGEREEVVEEKREPVQEKEKETEKEDVPQSEDSGEVGANWAAWVKQWVEKQEPARVAVMDFLLQLRATVESRVKQHWPLVRAWLLLIARVMLMLSLLGLEAAIRGFASLFRLGSAAHFLLLWCTVLGFIRLSGIFNLVIVLVITPLLVKPLCYVTFPFIFLQWKSLCV